MPRYLTFHGHDFFLQKFFFYAPFLHTDCGLRLTLLRATKTHTQNRLGIGTWGQFPSIFIRNISKTCSFQLLRPHQNFRHSGGSATVDRILQILAADLLLLQTDFASHEKANFSIFKFVHPIKMVTRLSVTLWQILLSVSIPST